MVQFLVSSKNYGIWEVSGVYDKFQLISKLSCWIWILLNVFETTSTDVISETGGNW
jgi:hypothetical protein